MGVSGIKRNHFSNTTRPTTPWDEDAGVRAVVGPWQDLTVWGEGSAALMLSVRVNSGKSSRVGGCLSQQCALKNPGFLVLLIQARTSRHLVTHGCLSVLTRTQREGLPTPAPGKKKRPRKESTAVKQNKIFLHAVLVTSARGSLGLHFSSEMQVATQHGTSHPNKTRNLFLPTHFSESAFHQHPSSLSFFVFRAYSVGPNNNTTPDLCSTERGTHNASEICALLPQIWTHFLQQTEQEDLCLFLFFAKDGVPASKLTPFISPAGSQHVPSPRRCRYLK